MLEEIKEELSEEKIKDEFKAYYYRSLSEYPREKGFLVETCLVMQDKYEEIMKKYLPEL